MPIAALIAGLFLFAAPARAQQNLFPDGWKPIAVSQWGGLNLLNDSTMIQGDAQSAQNVLTDSGYLEKRPGNVILDTILSGSPVQYAGEWYAANGNHYLIAQASQTIYETNFSGSPVEVSTIATGFNVSAVSAFSRFEVADGFRPLWYWNGTSTGAVTDTVSGELAPICTYVAYQNNRLWCANLPDGYSVPGNTENGGGSSTVLISSSGGDGYWSVPSNVGLVDNVPNRIDFNPDDGDEITCMASTPWGMFVAKRNSSYIEKGSGNLSYYTLMLDPKIGCVDNRSVQMVYGTLEWLAVDGVYGYNGSGHPQLLTRKLDPLMLEIREASFSRGQWATQLQSDWESGTTSAGTQNLPPNSWDEVSIAGEIFPSSFTLHDDNTSPSLQTEAGFSSDTLVNIDTTTNPLNTGFAQIAPSTSGIMVWKSSFPAGNFTVGGATWTQGSGALFESPFGCTANNEMTNSPGVINCSNAGNKLYELYTMAASFSTAPVNGWTFGAWSFQWMPLVQEGAPTNTLDTGRCAPVASVECAELDFISDNDTNNAWNGYGVGLYQTDQTGDFSIQLVKSIAGVKSQFGTTYNINIPVASYGAGSFPVAFSTITVTKTSGGYFEVYLGTSPVAAGFDNSINTKANLTAINLYNYYDGATTHGYNWVSSTSLQGFAASAQIYSRIFDTQMAAPLPGIIHSSYTTTADGATALTFQVRSSTSPNNDLWTNWQTPSGSVPTNMNRRYWEIQADFTTSAASETPTLGYMSLEGITTGYYYSKVNFVGSLITSWIQFGVTENTPGTFNYAVREATYAFSPSATSPSWTSQTANENVNLSVSTPTYAQFRLDSTGLTDADVAEPISGIFLRWNQGQNIPVASATLDRRYYLCVTISTAATAPDTCLIYQKNQEWIPWVGPSIGAMGIYDYNIIAADGGTSSKVWKIMQPNVYSDDGSPINAFWISQDFTDGLVFNDKTYYGAMFDATPVQGSSVTVSFSFDKSDTTTSKTFSIDNMQPLDPSLPVQGEEYGNINQWFSDPNGWDTARYIRAEFSDNNLNDYFRINSYMLLIQDKPWQKPD